MQKKQGNIKVYCRFRPFNKKQLQQNSQKLHRISNKTQLIIKDLKADKQDEMSFMFDHAFDTHSTQEEVFSQVGFPVLQNILDGFNGTIMAYGQTSSGKTHTMQGYDMTDKEAKGIMPRIVHFVKTQIEKLFSTIQKSTESIEYKLKISIFELYMEKIRDLLDVSKGDLKIRENKLGPYIQNLTEVYVGEKSQIFKLISLGQKNRITCATNMNQHSSRSHMIFMLSLNQFNNQDSSSKTSKLYLIDLAGSQKVSKTGAEGKVLEEAKKINLSLTNLGKVIKHLAQKHSHIPYRDSKLTRVLKDSLGGNSKTTLIVTCSPHEMHLPQTISTLRFGQNAQKIKNKPKINRELTVQQLQKIVEKLQEEGKAKELKIEFLEKYIKETLNGQLPDYKQIAGLLVKLEKDEKQGRVKLEQEVSSIKESESVKDETEREQIGDEPELNLNDLKGEKDPQKEGLKQLSQEQEKYYISRIAEMEEQLSKANTSLSKQAQKYHELKKQYAELHDNIASILQENIKLQQIKQKLQVQKAQIEQKLANLQYQTAIKQSAQEYNSAHKQANKIHERQFTSESSSLTEDTQKASLYEHELENQLIQNNSTLIKMIVGEIFSIIGPYQEQQIVKVIENDHWYKQIILDGVNCVDFYEYEKEQMNSQIQDFIKQKQSLEKHINDELHSQEKNLISDSKYSSLLEQFKLEKEKQNQKIITLQNKLDKLFDEYHQMISLQTSWKAQCQLYERKLKKKEEKIQELEEMLQELSEQISYLEGYNDDDYEDTKSVKSKKSKIVKPLKGGAFFFK